MERRLQTLSRRLRLRPRRRSADGWPGQFNPDVASTAQIPDTYLYISTAPTSIGVDQPKDLFLVATGIWRGRRSPMRPTALRLAQPKVNEIKQYSDVTRVNQALGRRARSRTASGARCRKRPSASTSTWLPSPSRPTPRCRHGNALV